jgi:hypothetical protein
VTGSRSPFSTRLDTLSGVAKTDGVGTVAETVSKTRSGEDTAYVY